MALPTFMKIELRPAICALLSLLLCRGLSEESPGYIFELSDEPVKVPYKKPDTSGMFFPKYSKGTTPETLEDPTPDISPDLSVLEEPPADITVRMNTDETTDANALSGYEFYTPPAAKDVVITTEGEDPSVWLNDCDPHSLFFCSKKSVPVKREASPAVNADEPPDLTPPERDDHMPPIVTPPDEDGWNGLPQGYVPIPTLPAYKPN